MKNPSLKRNSILSIVNTISRICFPLISFPYVARILGPVNLGQYNFSASIVSYFSLMAMLGINVYAVREGAKIRDNRVYLEKFVSEVLSFNIFTCIISCSLFLFCIYFINDLHYYRELLLIQALAIPVTVLGVDWINSIFEDYLYLTLRNIFFQIISLVLLFVFVKTPEDILVYAGIGVVSSTGSCLLNYFYTNRYCKKILTYKLNIKHHIKPIFTLFTTSVAAMLYSSSDITMLGFMTDDNAVGIYSSATKVYTISKQLLFAVIVVCLPRFSYWYERLPREVYGSKLQKLLEIFILLSFPLVAGIIALRNQIIGIIAGIEYMPAAITLSIKSFAILFAIFAYFFMQLVILPAKKDSCLLYITVISGLLNVLANFIFIPLLKENGAAVTTVISEFTVLVLAYIVSVKIVKLHVPVSLLLKVLTMSMIMYYAITTVSDYFDNTIISFISGFIVGTISYGILAFATRTISITDIKEDFK